MKASQKYVERMLKRPPRRRSITRSMVAPSSGLRESAFGPVIEYSPSWGKRGQKGAKLWTQGWHAAAAYVWGEDWALEASPGLDLSGRLDQAGSEGTLIESLAENVHAQAGWTACVQYCASRLSEGAGEELLVHDLQAIVDTYWASQESSRPKMSRLVRKTRHVS